MFVKSHKVPLSYGLFGTAQEEERKSAAIWISEEEGALIEFLLSEFSASSNGNPKKATFKAAASLLKERFLNASGVEKTSDAYRNKWQSSDEFGAGIVRKNDDVYRYIKQYPAARSFKSKEFEHFSAIEQMMSKISKGTHVYDIPNVPTTSSLLVPVSISDQPEATPPTGTLTFGQLTSVTQNIITT
ncbi:hypothetical protein BDR06DRAFT_969140 [Suillus hirtellus]|nr:hypothetical protein BDR06DRAFT_969140 [Suillus hirtellus]